MIDKNYNYQILDNLEFDLIFANLKNKCTYERLIIKVFKKQEDIIIIESLNGKDEILNNKKITQDELLNYNLTFISAMERLTNKEEDIIYEKLHNIGNWLRVKKDNKKYQNKQYSAKKELEELIDKILV